MEVLVIKIMKYNGKTKKKYFVSISLFKIINYIQCVKLKTQGVGYTGPRLGWHLNNTLVR